MPNIRPASYLFLFTLLTGCASFEKKTDHSSTPASTQMSAAATLSDQRVKAATADVEKQYELAKTENYAFYAPDSWEETNRKIKAMEKLVRQFEPDNQGFFGGPSEKKVMAAIQQAQSSIDKAGKTKGLMTDFLAEIFTDIEYLKPLVGTKSSKEFNKITAEVNKLIIRVERKGDTLNYQTERAELRQKLQKLEIKVVTEKYYAPLKRSLTELDKTLIPQTYSKASSSLAKLNSTITQYPRDNLKIQQFADIVKNQISLAHLVTTDVKWINGLNDSQTEAVVIRYREAIDQLSKNILDKTLPPLAFSNQVTELEKSILAKIAETETLHQAALTEQEELIGELKAQLNGPAPADETSSQGPSLPSADDASESTGSENSKKQGDTLIEKGEETTTNEISAKIAETDQ